MGALDFISHPGVIVVIVLYFLFWHFPGWYVVAQYSHRIVEARPERIPKLKDPRLLEKIAYTPILQLASDFPTTWIHFVFCYSLRVADTFSAARLTTFWAAYWSMLCIAPIFCCYIPLMRSSLREQLGGDTWVSSDLLMCICPWAHYFLCYGFREAIVVDIASEVTIQWPYDSMVGFISKPHFDQKYEPTTFHTKIAADLHSVGEPIKVMSLGSPTLRATATTKPARMDVDLEEYVPQEKPITRPQCISFLEGGKCAFGHACYWRHGANPDQTQTLDCPKKHGVRKLAVDHRAQCTSCQNFIFVRSSCAGGLTCRLLQSLLQCCCSLTPTLNNVPNVRVRIIIAASKRRLTTKRMYACPATLACASSARHLSTILHGQKK